MEIRKNIDNFRHIQNTGNSYTNRQNDPSERILNPSESFQKTTVLSQKAFYDLREIAGKLLSNNIGKEVWSFTAGSSLMMKVGVSPSGRVMCQDQSKIYSLDKNTGKKMWELPKDRKGISSLEAAPDGTVFTDEAIHGCLLAIDGDTGKEKWRCPEHGLGYTGIVHSKTDDGLFFSGLDWDMKKRKIISLDEKTGETKWETSFESSTVSTDKLSGDGSSLISLANDDIISLDAHTGKEKWRFDTKGDNSATTPSVGLKGDTYYSGKDNTIHAIDGSTGKEKWSFKTGDQVVSPPVVAADGSLFQFEDGKISSIDPDTGKALWEYKSNKDTIVHLGMTSSGDILTYNINSGKILEIDGKKGNLKSANRLQKPWMQACVDKDGLLYYAGDEKIHAIKISLKEEDVEKMLQESQKQQESEEKGTIEKKGDFVVIGNVKLPINPNRR